MNSKVEVEVSVGELLDKITILEIKRERIGDETKLKNIGRELAALLDVKDRQLHLDLSARSIFEELKSTNERLWDIEDQIRECERAQDFGQRFVGLARSVYFQNDLRAKYKRQLNDLLGSEIIEEKSYAGYTFHS